jgi:hypothetical protein
MLRIFEWLSNWRFLKKGLDPRSWLVSSYISVHMCIKTKESVWIIDRNLTNIENRMFFSSGAYTRYNRYEYVRLIIISCRHKVSGGTVSSILNLCAGLKGEASFNGRLSSFTRTLRSWIWIPLKAWMSVLCAFILCVGRGPATGWSRIQGSYRLCLRSRNWKAAEAQQRAAEP